MKPATAEWEVWPGTVEWGCILVVDISTDTHAGKKYIPFLLVHANDASIRNSAIGKKRRLEIK